MEKRQAKNAADMTCGCCGDVTGSHGIERCPMNVDNRPLSISLSQGLRIADFPDRPEHKGRFICGYLGDGRRVYEAIDNLGTELKTKSFERFDDAFEWLTGDNTNG